MSALNKIVSQLNRGSRTRRPDGGRPGPVSGRTTGATGAGSRSQDEAIGRGVRKILSRLR